MADYISQITLPNNETYNFKDAKASIRGIEYIRGTWTATSGTWTGVSTDTELYDGKQIILYMPFAGSGNATLNLTLADGTLTGPINVYYESTSRFTTHKGAYSQLHLIYHVNHNINGTNYTGWWYIANRDTNDGAYYVRYTYPNMKAGTGGIDKYVIIMQLPDGRWSGITTGTWTTNSSGNPIPIATGKSASPNSFLPGNVMIMYANATYSENANVGTYNVYSFYGGLIDARYSFNLNSSDTNKFTAYLPIYLVGSLDENGLFVLNSGKWWSQTLPSSNDDQLYIYIGQAYDWYRMSLAEEKPIYWYKNNKIQLYSGISDYALEAGNASTVNNLTVQTAVPQNAVFTALSTSSAGYVSQAPNDTTKFLRGDANWASPPDTTYTIATGDANGQIKVTPSSGNAYNVNIKGLGSAAYTPSTDYSYKHLSDYDFTMTQPLSKYVTFDKSKPVGAPEEVWYNGFVSSHSNYHASYIINSHSDYKKWYVGHNKWREADNPHATAPTWYLLAHSGNVGTGDNNGQVKIAGVNVSVKGLGSAAYIDKPSSNTTTTWLRGDGSWVAPPNDDTHVNMKTRGTTKAYLLATTTAPTSSNQAVESVAETAVYLDTTAGYLHATKFNGYTLGAACEKGVTDNSSNTDVTNNDQNLITGRTLYYQLAKKNYLTSHANGYGQVTVSAQSSATTALSTSNAAVTITSKSSNEILKFTTANQWICIAGTESTTAGSDEVKFAHYVPSSITNSGPSSAQTPGYNSTFNIPVIALDAAGHVTGISTTTVKIPDSDNSTTKLIVGGTSATSNTNISTGNVCLRLFDDTTHRNTIQLHAGDNVTITNTKTNDTNTTITIEATDTTYTFQDNYNASTNPGATVKTVSDAIDALTPADLGLDNALHFIGRANTNLTENSSTVPSITGKTNYSPVSGDVVLGKDNGREYVWDGDVWLLLGQEASTAYNSDNETASTSANNTWISKITQDTDRQITIERTTLDTSGRWTGTADSWTNARKVYVALGTASKTVTINGSSTANDTAIGIGVDGKLGIGYGGTNADSVNKYGIVYGNSAENAYASTATGGTGEVLMSGGANAAPSWYSGLILSSSGSGNNISYEVRVVNKLTFKNSSNSYIEDIGNAYTPIYWKDGQPAKTTPIQKISFQFNHTYPTEVHLSHTAITTDTCVSEIVVTDGLQYLHDSIDWEIVTVNTTTYLKLNTTSAITSNANDNKTISGYVIIGPAADITPTYLSISSS